MKSFITALGVTAALGVSVASAPAFAGSLQGMADCNAEYAACLKDGTNMSMATSIGGAVSQGSDNTSNWMSCSAALAACYGDQN